MVEQTMEMGGGGTLVLRQEGPRVSLEARRRADNRGLYKVWLHGDEGGKLLLGTLVPEGDTLTLRRTLSVRELERAGCWPRFRVEAPLAFSFSGGNGGKWYCEQHPERLLSDPVVRGQVRGPMLCRRDREGFRLAAPFRTDRPVALDVLLCLARVERWDGRDHIVWKFDGEGRPEIIHKEPDPGQNNRQ